MSIGTHDEVLETQADRDRAERANRAAAEMTEKDTTQATDHTTQQPERRMTQGSPSDRTGYSEIPPHSTIPVRNEDFRRVTEAEAVDAFEKARLVAGAVKQADIDYLLEPRDAAPRAERRTGWNDAGPAVSLLKDLLKAQEKTNELLQALLERKEEAWEPEYPRIP